MLEAIPRAADTVAQAAPSLCSKLMAIEFIDLAEQALSCLAKLSKTCGEQVLDTVRTCLRARNSTSPSLLVGIDREAWRLS